MVQSLSAAWCAGLRSLAAGLVATSLLLSGLAAFAAPPERPVSRGAAGAQTAEPGPQDAAADAQQQLIASFSKLLSGATMTGSFTVDRPADDDAAATPPREESYEISSATHLGGELWLITSRIRYGDVDATVPVPVAVKWAGTTPVITLDQVTLPGMGTFSARVLFHGDRYAGTWQHDAVGGHMFGKVAPKVE